jgi:hypothetical protein
VAKFSFREGVSGLEIDKPFSIFEDPISVQQSLRSRKAPLRQRGITSTEDGNPSVMAALAGLETPAFLTASLMARWITDS